MEFRFCPICGAYLEKNLIDAQALPVCPLGHFTLYPNVAAAHWTANNKLQARPMQKPHLVVLQKEDSGVAARKTFYSGS